MKIANETQLRNEYLKRFPVPEDEEMPELFEKWLNTGVLWGTERVTDRFDGQEHECYVLIVPDRTSDLYFDVDTLESVLP